MNTQDTNNPAPYLTPKLDFTGKALTRTLRCFGSPSYSGLFDRNISLGSINLTVPRHVPSQPTMQGRGMSLADHLATILPSPKEFSLVLTASALRLLFCSNKLDWLLIALPPIAFTTLRFIKLAAARHFSSSFQETAQKLQALLTCTAALLIRASIVWTLVSFLDFEYLHRYESLLTRIIENPSFYLNFLGNLLYCAICLKTADSFLDRLSLHNILRNVVLFKKGIKESLADPLKTLQTAPISA